MWGRVFERGLETFQRKVPNSLARNRVSWMLKRFILGGVFEICLNAISHNIDRFHCKRLVVIRRYQFLSPKADNGGRPFAAVKLTNPVSNVLLGRAEGCN